VVHPLSGSLFSIPGRLEFVNFVFWWEGKTGVHGTNNPNYKTQKRRRRRFEPGQHCWEACALPALAILAPLTKRFVKDCAYIGKTICINVSFQVTMSYLQIYQEKIYDLLNSTSKIELSLREHPVKGEDIYVTYTWVLSR